MKAYIKSAYNIITANLIVVIIISLYHSFILLTFGFNVFFHVEGLFFNLGLIILMLYVRYSIITFTNAWFVISVIYFSLLLFISSLELCGHSIDIFRYIISSNELYLEVQDVPVFYDLFNWVIDNIINYVDCFDNPSIDKDRQIDPVHDSRTWCTNATRTKKCLTGAGLGLTPIAFLQSFMCPTALAKIPTGVKVGVVSFSTGVGIGVEIISHWH